VQAPELEDLKHIHQIHARRDHDQAETDQYERPTGVQVAFVIAVRDEA